MKVRVYRNLHNGKLSVMNCSSGLIEGHAVCLSLKDVTFVISKAGKKRARDSGERNVHAFAEGEIVRALGLEPFKGRNPGEFPEMVLRGPELKDMKRRVQLTYKPFLDRGFHPKDHDGEDVTSCDVVFLGGGGGIYAYFKDHCTAST